MHTDHFHAILVKKADTLAKEAEIRNNFIWVEKNEGWCLYVQFFLRKEFLFSAHGNLLTGHEDIKKCKQSLMNCYWWLNMDEDIKNTGRNA
jgi:hypothetical protein